MSNLGPIKMTFGDKRSQEEPLLRPVSISLGDDLIKTGNFGDAVASVVNNYFGNNGPPSMHMKRDEITVRDCSFRLKLNPGNAPMIEVTHPGESSFSPEQTTEIRLDIAAANAVVKRTSIPLSKEFLQKLDSAIRTELDGPSLGESTLPRHF